MKKEYNHLIEVHGKSEIRLIFGSFKGYADVRKSSTYLKVSSEIDDLMSSYGGYWT